MGLPDGFWLLAAFAAGAAIGWWFGRRPREPESGAASLVPTPPTATEPEAVLEAPQASSEPQRETALAAAVAAAATVIPGNNYEPLPADIQALLDKGQAFDAVKQLRLARGGVAARAMARQHLRPGAHPLPADITRLIKSGNKIGAIHRLCEQTHMDLRLAHELIERHDAAPR